MKKIPFTRLKVAQIDRKKLLPALAWTYCRENPAFLDKENRELICHADIFQEFINKLKSREYNFPVEKLIKSLEDLNKQFISFDYIMII